MVEITKPMGSYHIIDGEKVSVKYRGQIRTERDCSGKAVARDCQEDRVLLSTHMGKHWQEIGFTPANTSTAMEPEEDLEIDVQIGRDKIKKLIQTGPDLTQRYSSIMISGFSSDQNLIEIHQLLISQGLPESIKCEDIEKNDRSGKLTIENLGASDCLLMMEKLHGKKFLGKKVFVTSVVSASPVKTSASSASTSGTSPPTPPPQPSLSTIPANDLKLKITRNLKPTTTNFTLAPVVIIEAPSDKPDLANSAGSGSGSDSDSENELQANPVSPGMQAKIDLFDPLVLHQRKTSHSEKRKAPESPEKNELETDNSTLSKSELKSLRKRQKKLKKLGHKEAEKNLLKNNGQ